MATASLILPNRRYATVLLLEGLDMVSPAPPPAGLSGQSG